jgi:hypothetical protein
MSASAAAAYGVDAFLNNPAGEMAIGRARPKLILAGLIGIEVFLAAGIWVITRQLLPEILLGAGWVTLTAVLVLLRLSNRIKADWFMAGILAAAIFGPAINNRMGFQPRAAEDIFGEANLAAAYLKVQPGQFRVYSPSYSIPQHTAVFYGLELADGVDPLQLRSYVDFMERATGVPAKGYSVTIPPFSTGDPRIDNQNYLPDPRLLGWLNVRFVVSGFELDHQALTLRARIGDLWIYENTRAFPRAWLEDVDEAQGIRQVKVKDWSPNRILLEAEGSGRVVVSEIYYPGWEVEVDGVPKTIEPYAGILRSVEVREGEHQITFTFRPRTVNLGLWLAAASWGMLVVLFIFRKKAAPN